MNGIFRNAMDQTMTHCFNVGIFIGYTLFEKVTWDGLIADYKGYLIN